MEDPEQILRSDAEDIHSWVEQQLNPAKSVIWAKSFTLAVLVMTKWRQTWNYGVVLAR